MPDMGLDLVKKRFESAKKVVDLKLSDFQRWEDWRNCKLPKELRSFFEGEHKGRSALVPPTIRTMLNDLESKIVNSIFSIKPHFELLSEQYPQEILEKNQKLLLFQWDQEPIKPEARYRAKVARQVSDWLTYGIGIKACIWREVIDPISGELIYEGAGFDNVSPYRFYPSPYWDTEGNLAFYFIRSVVFYQNLLDNPNFDEEAVKGIELEQFGAVKKKVEHYAQTVDFDKLDLTSEADKMICPVLVDTYVDKNVRMTVANEKNIIKDVENWDKSPNLGLSILNVGRPEGEFYGTSVIDVIEDNFIEKFHKRNQRLDESNISIYSQFLSDDPKAPPMFKTAPGKVHKVGTGRLESYKELEFHGQADRGFVEEQLVTKELKQALNLEDLPMGFSPERRETATTNLILNQNAASPMQYTISKIEDAVVINDVHLALAKNVQFFPANPPIAYRGLDIEKHEIIYMVQVRPLGITQAVSRPVLASQITGLMEQWKGIDEIARDVEWLELAKRQLHALQFPDPEKILPDPRTKMIPVTKENFLIAQGVQVPVDPDEDHMFHDRLHEAFENGGMLPPEFWDGMQAHRGEHQMYMEKQMPTQGKGGAITDEQQLSKRMSGEMQPQRGSPRPQETM